MWYNRLLLTRGEGVVRYFLVQLYNISAPEEARNDMLNKPTHSCAHRLLPSLNRTHAPLRAPPNAAASPNKKGSTRPFLQSRMSCIGELSSLMTHAGFPSHRALCRRGERGEIADSGRTSRGTTSCRSMV